MSKKKTETTNEALDASAGALGEFTSAELEAAAADIAEIEEIEDDEDFGDFKPRVGLEAPKPRPGFVQRWVRMSILGQADTKNVAKIDRQKWKPRRFETVPERERMRFSAFRHSAFGDVIVEGDVMLCERPERVALAHRKYFQDKTAAQVGSLVQSEIDKGNQAAGGGFGPVTMTRATKVTTRRPIVDAG